MKLNKIKYLIFDLGGVIIDLNPDATFQSLATAGRISLAELKTQLYSTSIFTAFERGDIGAAEFRDGVRKQLDISISDFELDTIWNAMLLGIPLKRIKLLQALRPHFKMFVLSNTNEIHVTAFNKIVDEVTGEPNLDSFFDQVYFSHDLNCRKPELQIYQKVLDLNNLPPDEVLFLDDREENLVAAAKLGIQTFEVSNPDLLFELFVDWPVV